MIEISYRTNQGILKVEPKDALSSEDFNSLSSEIKRIQKEEKDLAGLLIRTKKFPGYEKLSDALAHVDFIGDHREQIQKVALCSDSAAADFFQGLGRALAHAEIKQFDYDDEDDAEKWLLS